MLRALICGRGRRRRRLVLLSMPCSRWNRRLVLLALGCNWRIAWLLLSMP
jgi:hypothetical protein